ncbi:hypothetical protein LPC08_25285 (plasmid) [Roseomonas sp. OT10]|uniref:hypothetical protein n=1 Tax=Roseomonas cutis TaxID=2897332 RepID=UPI001E33B075|nr:hypothetical protein [Roseomonas sp. OT10]UFN51580.1 hypothetical protein LPC08_25285 [Roseomonas sp. OT10]
MLVDMMSGKRITKVPYEVEYRRMTSLMTPTEVTAVKAALNAEISGTRIQTAGWMPGSDWRGTPYQAIYEKAARCNEQIAARCFGLIVWEVFMERPEKWTSGRFEKDGEPIGSRTYFQVS